MNNAYPMQLLDRILTSAQGPNIRMLPIQLFHQKAHNPALLFFINIPNESRAKTKLTIPQSTVYSNLPLQSLKLMPESCNLNHAHRPAHKHPRHPLADPPTSLKLQDIVCGVSAGSNGATIQLMRLELIDSALHAAISLLGRKRASFPVPSRE